MSNGSYPPLGVADAFGFDCVGCGITLFISFERNSLGMTRWPVMCYEFTASPAQPIDIRCDRFVTVAAKFWTQIINGDKQNVGLVRCESGS